MRTMMVVAVVLGAAACGGDGGDDAAIDTLPKKGATATDPTIVSASATCSGDLMFKGLVLLITGSDPGGASNLGGCSASADAATAQGTFATECEADIVHECTDGVAYTVDVTVSNKTGGVTTAKITVHPVN